MDNVYPEIHMRASHEHIDEYKTSTTTYGSS